MTKVIKFYANWCGPCKIYNKTWDKVVAKLGDKVEFVEVDIEENGMTREDLYEKTGGRTVPQIVVDGKTIGGYNNLLELESDGMLIV